MSQTKLLQEIQKMRFSFELLHTLFRRKNGLGALSVDNRLPDAAMRRHMVDYLNSQGSPGCDLSE
jgi:hypothetical protein